MLGGRPHLLRGALLFALVASGYALGYKLSQHWFSAPDQGASFFPPAGLTLATLVLVHRRRWPVVLAAAGLTELALDLSRGITPGACVGYALANTLEPLVGALLLTTVVGRVDLRRTRDLAGFLVCAVVLAPMVGGTIAATTFVLDGGHGWWRFAFEWWSGDGLGVLVVGSAMLALRPRPRLPARQLTEGILLGLVAVGGTASEFGFGWFPFVYLPIAILVVLAFRVGTVGVALTGAACAFVAAGSTAEAEEFWRAVDIRPADRILFLQLALAVIISAVLALAAEIAERERIAKDLARAESERVAALERAELTESEKRARIHAESLGRSAALLSQSTTEADVAAAAVSVMADWGASQSTVYLVGGGRLVLVAATGVNDESWRRFETIPLDLKTPSAVAAREGVPVVVQSGAEFDSSFPSLADYRRTHPWETIVAFPLIVGESVRAVACARMAERDWVTEDRYELLSTLADQATVALERAALLRLEREARVRAELLETNARRLAAATTASEVAATTLRGLEQQGVASGWIHVVDGDWIELVETLNTPEENERQYRRYRIDASTPSAEAARTGAVVEVERGEDLDVGYPDLRAGRRRMPFESIVSVPLFTARGRILGVLTFTSAEREWLTPALRQLVLGIAEQCGLALERSRLQAEADAAAEEEALLAHLGEVLERRTGAVDRAREVVEALVSRAALATIHEVDEAGRPQMLAQAAAAGMENAAAGLREVAARAVGADGPVTDTAGGLHVVSVPLRARDHTRGVLTLAVPAGDRARVTQDLAQRIATRVALALDNAFLYEQERDVSHSLQLGLLGGEPESGEGTEIATAYRPGTATLEVGGDWYDAFTLPSGRLALIVGDVVGHGLDAAVAMGQLRGAVRALAPLGSPSEVLRGLDLFVEQLPAAAMATLAYAELDLDEGLVRYACAGHPPPLLVPADGAPRLLWEGRSTPLGSSFIGRRDEAVDLLRPGDTIVLYTDGLVERRADGISLGLELLVEVAGVVAGRTPPELVDAILGSLLCGEAQEDDVCVLAVARARVGVRFTRVFPASPAAVSDMRRAFASWLVDTDVETTRQRDAVLAVAEAAANAAEHAYDFDGEGLVKVDAWIADGALEVAVRDAGTWREPKPQTDRGRGRTIMSALMDEVRVEYRRGGTHVRMRLPLREEVMA